MVEPMKPPIAAPEKPRIALPKAPPIAEPTAPRTKVAMMKISDAAGAREQEGEDDAPPPDRGQDFLDGAGKVLEIGGVDEFGAASGNALVAASPRDKGVASGDGSYGLIRVTRPDQAALIFAASFLATPSLNWTPSMTSGN